MLKEKKDYLRDPEEGSRTKHLKPAQTEKRLLAFLCSNPFASKLATHMNTKKPCTYGARL